MKWPWVIFCLTLLLSRESRAEESYKIGLAVGSGYPESVKGFKEGLSAAGLTEGKNVQFLYGKKGIDKNLQRTVAEQFKKAKADLVYSLTTSGTAIVKEVIPPQTPIVFSIVTYPADSGLIESFEYSGNNLVGTSNYVPTSHYLSVAQLLLPNISTVAIFHRKGEPNSKVQTANMIRLLKRAGIKAIDREPENLQQVRDMAQELVGHTDLFMATSDTLMQGGGESVLIDISMASKIPILSANKSGIEQGSTFGPVVDFYTLGKMAGDKAAQILIENIPPAKLETELQDPPIYLVNRQSLDKLGIQISTKTANQVQWTQ
ncbi:ABC transporter substrate-binding protein [Motiliproteus sp. MSK22-1]|uniref:ABC transporter substrate-binding protein n=1 Tax=Motiliproteus sp. MSK22-1 TaxID=1897630 RepID=UPI0009771B1D|nr:ABC transporter substrate-binding protein [Motiliproteus sp. MSK22-1]OMH30430.1 hypothetical protein BGP75_18840 [Motiliproteus sp. MSK22-1]